jgi:hypothetical protein
MKKLKYKWSAVYSDGSILHSNEEDISIKDPTRSAYYDIDQDRLIAFSLYDETNEYLIDLRDGHFEINQVPFKLHSENISEPKRLIYFHRNTVNLTQIGNEDPEVESHTREFHIGWQATVNGENIQRTIRFD